jgi:tripartite ATP-independent transporter DctP family solute receptor
MLKLKTMLLTGLVGLAMVASTSADAQIRERKFRLGIQTNNDTAQGQSTQKFADLIAQKSGNRLKMDVFFGGSLGGDLQTISALRGGTIDGTILATSTLVGIVKEFALFDLPFLFQSDAEAMAVVDGQFGKILNAGLSDRDLIGLAYWGAGYRHLTNSRHPVTKLEDIKGLKLRVLQNPVYIDLWNTLGANAVPMPFPEVYAALEQKTVDGQENPAATLISAKLSEVQKYLSLTQHIYFVSAIIFSKPVWNQLNADERKVITDAAAETQAFARVAVPGEDKTILETLRKQMTVNELAPAELARLRDAAKPVVDKYAAAADPAASKALFDSIAAVRK